MATVTPVPAGNPRANLGQFHVGVFNLLIDTERDEYEALRTKNQSKVEGVKIEKIREFTKRTEVIEGTGEGKMVTKTEDLYVIVEYWQRTSIKTKESGDGKEDVESAENAIAGR